ncbi:hypothetical protein KCU81_g4464, partial [Aureobasidium melanogenum]|uniref:DNA endonuclease Ctp1 N-terminal domain-containing protein n=1 Tax=Aureobasidium melanogenum (strain CBS 110374) TaxID=1043003 RepID=A0A074W4X5_AURM1
MAAPQRSLRQDIELLRQRLDGLEPGVPVTFNKLRDQIQTLEQKTHAYAQRIHALEEQSQALREQNRVLQERIRTIEEENRPFETLEADSDSSSEVLFTNTIWIDESTLEDVTPAFGDAASEHNSEIGSPEDIPSPINQQASASSTTIRNDDEEFVVWFENGTLRTNAPEHLLTTQDWRDLLAAFAKPQTFLTDKNADWHSITRTDVCVRDVIQKSKGQKSMQWTMASPGKFCCKRCLNTQRVCLKYNEEGGRLEALPLPEAVRPEDAPFGVRWFVAEQPNMSNKAGFKGLWRAA